MAFSADHFAFAASHSPVVHFSMSVTVEEAGGGATVVEGEACVGGAVGVCAKLAPTLMKLATAAVDNPSRMRLCVIAC